MFDPQMTVISVKFGDVIKQITFLGHLKTSYTKTNYNIGFLR